MSSLITGENHFVTEIGRYNKYRAKQCTHTGWWLVLGWVTIKKYHPCIRFRNDTLHVNIGLHLHVALHKLQSGNSAAYLPLTIVSRAHAGLSRRINGSVDAQYSTYNSPIPDRHIQRQRSHENYKCCGLSALLQAKKHDLLRTVWLNLDSTNAICLHVLSFQPICKKCQPVQCRIVWLLALLHLSCLCLFVLMFIVLLWLTLCYVMFSLCYSNVS